MLSVINGCASNAVVSALCCHVEVLGLGLGGNFCVSGTLSPLGCDE